MTIPSADQSALLATWRAKWDEALAVWSRYTRLSEPRWCFTEKDETREQLLGSFAMIRLVDHAVVISLRQIRQMGLESFGLEILAHEIGHHVYAPADLRDNARLLARTRAGLPTMEPQANMVANLYTDLLINDRLQHGSGLHMAEVYRKLKTPTSSRLWTMYMRIYEILWSRPSGELATGLLDQRIQGDAQLGARVIRAYGKDWLQGAGRFAALCLPYLIEEAPKGRILVRIPWLDAQNAGAGGEIPEGLTGIDEDELDGAIHPSEDPELTGLGSLEEDDSGTPRTGGRAEKGGHKNRYRSPQTYTELMKSLGVQVSEKELVVRYYRERAIPHLIRFPVRQIEESTDPLPEGLDQWESGSPLNDLDWTESVVRSPIIIPGVTTVQRLYGTSPGNTPEKEPVDLYLGVDCSGSMGNPAYNMSYPVLAGTVITLSALRAGAKVMVCLSGEPGEFSQTNGFIRSEAEILKTLTGYLGTGYSFGITRLKKTFIEGEKPARPAHIMIVTDSDIFHMLGEVKKGWEIAAEALAVAGGGGTFVLQIPDIGYWKEQIQRLIDQGWDVHLVNDWEQMIAFARAFSQARYEKKQPPQPPAQSRRARKK